VTEQKKPSPLRVVVQLLVVVVLLPFLPLLISGQWDWWEAWVYAIICIGGFVVSRLLVARRHPDLLAERSRFMSHENAKSWDRILAPLVGLGGGFVPLVAGLEARLGDSPPFSAPLKLLALAVILAGYALGTWALMENRFFSGMVRIQTDRGHQVVSSGPYRWVRHPGYAGGLLTYLATAVWLDSRWALLPALFLTVVLVLRTALEDRTLQEELPGYAEYAGRVRYRLLPGVW
jgi:protein-S-isoprenylcysteine O-methyltransferase Ste14